jgi:hypothetical protein
MEKEWTVLGRFQPRRPNCIGNRGAPTRARARDGDFANKTLQVWITRRSPKQYFNSHWHFAETPSHFYSFFEGLPDRGALVVCLWRDPYWPWLALTAKANYWEGITDLGWSRNIHLFDINPTENYPSTIMAETEFMNTRSRQTMAELSKQVPQWASQACRVMKTILDLDGVLPERAGHGRVVLGDAADRIGGNWWFSG